jgi:hypothetical protein
MNRREANLTASVRRWSSLRSMGFVAMVLLATVLPGVGCSQTDLETKREQRVGGPCEYSSYPGQAEIVSVTPMNPSPMAAEERFDVKFRFIPDRPIEESLGRAAQQRTFSLLRDQEAHPDRAFVEQYGLRPGMRLACTLKVITRGACTPILFDFPSLMSGGASPR